MATKVFASSSGELSRRLAEVVHDWLPQVLQFVRPYFTHSDVEKGTKWASEISGELEGSDIGIICLTKENLDSKWIHFEAGALSKNLGHSRVCTVLFGPEPTDVTQPLALFQHTRFTKEDFKRLVETINNASKESRLPEPNLEKAFDKWWPEFDEQASQILKNYQPADEPVRRSLEDVMGELLELTRSLHRKFQTGVSWDDISSSSPFAPLRGVYNTARHRQVSRAVAQMLYDYGIPDCDTTYVDQETFLVRSPKPVAKSVRSQIRKEMVASFGVNIVFLKPKPESEPSPSPSPSSD